MTDTPRFVDKPVDTAPRTVPEARHAGRYDALRALQIEVGYGLPAAERPGFAKAMGVVRALVRETTQEAPGER